MQPTHEEVIQTMLTKQERRLLTLVRQRQPLLIRTAQVRNALLNMMKLGILLPQEIGSVGDGQNYLFKENKAL